MLIVLLSLVVLVGLVYGALWLPPVQQKIKDIVLKEVMKITNNKIQIGNLYLRPFNKLQLTDVFVDDQQGDTLLYAKNISAGFDIMKLMQNELLIKSIGLDDFLINVNKDSLDGDFNFQFLIDAFASDEPDTTSSSSMIIKITDISIKKGRINYDIFSEPKLSDKEFDFNHVHLSDINANLYLNSIDLKKLDAGINSFSFKEKSGLAVGNIRALVKSKGEKISLSKVLLKLTDSQLNIPEIWIDYTGSELGEIMEEGSFSIEFAENKIVPKELSMFFGPLANLKDNLEFKGKIEGSFPSVSISQLKANFGHDIRLDVTASIKDFNHWKKTPIELNLRDFSASDQSIENILIAFSGEATELPDIGNMSFVGKVKGVLPDLELDITGNTDIGSVFLIGNAGYDFDKEYISFDANLTTSDFDIKTLMQDSLFGLANVELTALGSVQGDKIDAEAEIRLKRFDYNNYTYSNIDAEGKYQGDSIVASINSRDDNIPMLMNAYVNLNKGRERAGLYLRADSLYIDTLNFLSEFKDTYVSTAIRFNVDGFDIEDMDMSLNIDSLDVNTDRGSFYQPHMLVSYRAEEDSRKTFKIDSRILNANAEGKFTFAGVMESIKGALPVLFENSKFNPELKDDFPANLNFTMALREANSLTKLLNIETQIPDSAFFMGRYANRDDNLQFAVSALTQFMDADTLQVSLIVSNIEEELSLILNLDNKSKNYDVDGSIDTQIEFVPVAGNSMPDMNIKINPSVFVVNETLFNINESELNILKDKYSVKDFVLDHGENEYIRIDGTVSNIPEDSLKVNVSKFEIGTLLGAMKTTNLPISGNANGEFVAKQLLTNPLILTRGFSINDILFADNDIGDLTITTVFNSQRQGIGMRASLVHEDRQQSLISGFILPAKDSLSITGTVRDIELKWLDSMTDGMLYGLDGSLNADMKINGKLSNPQIDGHAFFDKAKIGVSMLNTEFTTSDSIFIKPNMVDVRRFRIYDKHNRALTINGKVTHKQFAHFVPNINLAMNDFTVMDNINHTDSLFYGNMKLNGRLKISEINKEWVLSGDLSNSGNSTIMINLPTSASTAQRHNSITFVNSKGEDLDALAKEEERVEVAQISFPIRMNVTLSLDQGMTMGVIYNQATGDMARLNGSGLITFSYDLTSSLMSLVGDYTVDSGRASLSIANITKKEFAVEKGGKVTFVGDPLATGFDVTALYNLRADLTTLDEGFGNIGMASTRTLVNCSISVSGNLDKMSLTYDIKLPNEPDEIQRRLDGILYTDDDKILQIAYLLALGRFMPPDLSDMSGTNMTGSLASMGLNMIFSNLFKDNWSVDTNINTDDGGLSEMDVNISTSLLDNRLTITGTLGYNDSNTGSSSNPLSGDFMVEYKLIPSGNIVLKVYHKTNNKYFERALYTQGVGIVYKRGEKTFTELFKNITGKKPSLYNTPGSGNSMYRTRTDEEDGGSVQTNSEGESIDKNNE